MKCLDQLCKTLIVAICIAASATVWAQSAQIQGPANSQSVYSGVVYGPIDSNDTLWGIASRYRQNPRFSVYQVMMAIFELNRDAFENANFNTMVSGSMLQLPTERYIASVDPVRARAKADQDDQAIAQRRANQVSSATSTSNTNQTTNVPVAQSSQLSSEALAAIEQQLQGQLEQVQQQQADASEAIKDQINLSIQTTQQLMEKNQAVLRRVQQNDVLFNDLKNRIEQDFQSQLSEQARQIAELRALLEQNQQVEESTGPDWLDAVAGFFSSTLGILLSSLLVTLSALGGLAYVLLRQPTAEQGNAANTSKESSQSEVIEDEELVIAEADDETQHDSDADDLLAALDDDISDEDLVDDILADELSDDIDDLDALDDELDDFEDIDDEMLVPDQVSSEQADSEDEVIEALDDADIVADNDEDDSDEDDIDAAMADIVGDESGDDNAAMDDMDIDAILASAQAEASGEAVADEDDGEGLSKSVVDNLMDEEDDEIDQALGAQDEADVLDEFPEDVEDINIDDLLQEDDPDSELPRGITLSDEGEITEDTIAQIESSIAAKDEEINRLADNLLGELADGPQSSDTDVDDIEEADLAQELGQTTDEYAASLNITDEELDADDPIKEQLDVETERRLVVDLAEGEHIEDPTLEAELADPKELEALSNFMAEADEFEIPEDEDEAPIDLDDLLTSEPEEDDDLSLDGDELDLDSETPALDTDEQENSEKDTEDAEFVSLLDDDFEDDFESDLESSVADETDTAVDEVEEVDAAEEVEEADKTDAVIDEEDADCDKADDGSTDENAKRDDLADELLNDLGFDEHESDEDVIDDTHALADELLSELGSDNDSLDNDVIDDSDELAAELLNELNEEEADAPEADTPELDEPEELEPRDDAEEPVAEEELSEESIEDADLAELDEPEELEPPDDAGESVAEEELAEESIENADLTELDEPEELEPSDDVEESAVDDELAEDSVEEAEKVEPEEDDELAGLQDLDDWLSSDAAENQAEVDTQAISDDLPESKPEPDTENVEDILDDIENSDFDELLSEMEALTEIELDDEEEDVSSSSFEALDEELDNPDLDLSALLDDSEQIADTEQNEDASEDEDFLNVEDLIQESQSDSPKTDDELALDLGASLDSFLNEDEEHTAVDPDENADQASNLDLARVYIDMDDADAAREALEEVLALGTSGQKAEAKLLLSEIS